jgi:hypothetical protein
LGQSRQAGQFTETPAVAGDYSLQLRHELRPLRTWADHAHVAAHDIPKLRQLVDMRSAQKSADWEHARITFLRPCRPAQALAVVVHRANLIDLKWLASATQPSLGVENRTGRGKSHKKHSDQQQRPAGEQQNGRKYEIKYAPRRIPAHIANGRLNLARSFVERPNCLRALHRE